MAIKPRDYRSLAKAAAEAADDKKASDIVILDVRLESDVTDYLVMAGVSSSAQMGAVSLAVEESLANAGARVRHRDGRPRDRWVALDYGGLVVHILSPEARDFYRLEQLWDKVKRVKWNSK